MKILINDYKFEYNPFIDPHPDVYLNSMYPGVEKIKGETIKGLSVQSKAVKPVREQGRSIIRIKKKKL